MSFFYDNLSFFIFVAFLIVFLLIKRKQVEVQGSFPLFYFVLYKTKLGLDKMDKWSKKHPDTFLYLAYISIFIGIVGMFVSMVFMGWQLDFIVQKNLHQGGGFVLPLKTSGGMDGAVPVFYIPFLYWIVSLFILVVVHEFAHGVIAERFKIKIKSSGFAFLGVLVPLMPAAFVEPNQKQLNKKPWWQKVAVFGAGSTSNFIFGLLFLLLWIYVAVPFENNTMEVKSLSFSSVMNQSTFHELNVTSGTIVQIENVTNINSMINVLYSLQFNHTVHVTVRSHQGSIQNYSLSPFVNNATGKPMIGIILNSTAMAPATKAQYSYLGSLPVHFEKIIFYIWFLNLGIGIANLLPLWITDGGQIARTVLTRFLPKKVANILYLVLCFTSLFMIILILWPALLLAIF